MQIHIVTLLESFIFDILSTFFNLLSHLIMGPLVILFDFNMDVLKKPWSKNKPIFFIKFQLIKWS
jgi:hypothetical protein